MIPKFTDTLEIILHTRDVLNINLSMIKVGNIGW
jgi:hypothetical protein